MSEMTNLKGVATDSWACVDCGVNTAPGIANRTQMETAFSVLSLCNESKATIDDWSEVYTVKPAVWKATGLEGYGGCLCIGCLERRIGRTLVPKDFMRINPRPSAGEDQHGRYYQLQRQSKWRCCITYGGPSSRPWTR
jgi:hypothetical protein